MAVNVLDLMEFIETMNECGYNINENTLDEELIYDSLQFVSTMISLEERYNIIIPERFLTAHGLDTPRDFYNMITESMYMVE